MSTRSIKTVTGVLAQHEGACLLTAAEAIIKAALESEREVALIAGPRTAVFSPLFERSTEEPASTLLRRHGTRMLTTASATRAVTLTSHVARTERAAIALIPNEQLDATMPALTSLQNEASPQEGALIVIMEDAPRLAAASCPRQAARRVGLPCLEPRDVEQLRDAIEQSLRLSRIDSMPVALVVHESILHAAQTIEARPNRVPENIDVLIAQRRKRTRIVETGDVLRFARRLELNQPRSLPSPGELVPVGLISIGPTDPAIQYITQTLRLYGRVPVLQLRLLHPLDEIVISRFLERCERVVVLEPRPGSMEGAILAVGESLRRAGRRVAELWGRELPSNEGETTLMLHADEALHPSVLARKILHLLHMIRPSIQVATRLTPPPPPLAVTPLPRGMDVGPAAAIATLRRMLTEIGQWLREETTLLEHNIPPTALALDGIEPSIPADRVVPVEIWRAQTFVSDGLAAVRQAAREDRPWIIAVCDFAVSDGMDLERFSRGIVPGERAERVRIETANMGERTSLREQLQTAVVADRLTILLVRDASPPQFDLGAIEHQLTEVDEHGFEPLQVVVWPADQACLFPPSSEKDGPPAPSGDSPRRRMQTELTVDRHARRKDHRVYLKIQPLLEQIEVQRTRPPSWGWRSKMPTRLDLPTPIHRSHPRWRVHIAGLRGDSPGVATSLLADAGRHMDYDVSLTCDPTRIGPGRRAWAQLVYTRPRADDRQPPLSPTIPFGEANLLLGLDVEETLRSIDPTASLRISDCNQTYLVANCGTFSEAGGRELPPTVLERFAMSLGVVTQESPRLLCDFAAACRSWFHTDRLADIAMVGAAFQLGLIPVNLEAMESSLMRQEEHGYARSREAFEFGRRLAVDDRLLKKPRNDRTEDVHRMGRRLVLALRNGRWRGGSLARRFEGLLRRSLEAMPGLAETGSGRTALRDFVIALYRCLEWSGYDYAERYAGMITTLYRSDRGETGRAVTRHAIRPLAEALLIHDPIYIASMATNPEQRRLVRERLNVKPARGDQIERRYLTRVELIAFGRRMRADVRTSDWPARVARMARALLPEAWRGTLRERELRTFIVDLVQQAARNTANDYARWNEIMRRLHLHAVENRLRGMALSEVRMLVESSNPDNEAESPIIRAGSESSTT